MVMTRLGTQMGLLWATLGTLACIIIPVGRPRSNRFAWEIRTPTAAPHRPARIHRPGQHTGGQHPGV